MAFTCPRCGRTSHSPDDERHGYCGACCDWTGVIRMTATGTASWGGAHMAVVRRLGLAVRPEDMTGGERAVLEWLGVLPGGPDIGLDSDCMILEGDSGDEAPWEPDVSSMSWSPGDPEL